MRRCESSSRGCTTPSRSPRDLASNQDTSVPLQTGVHDSPMEEQQQRTRRDPLIGTIALLGANVAGTFLPLFYFAKGNITLGMIFGAEAFSECSVSYKQREIGLWTTKMTFGRPSPSVPFSPPTHGGHVGTLQRGHRTSEKTSSCFSNVSAQPLHNVFATLGLWQV